METKFLKDLGLNDDQIKSIMAENGKDVEREKESTKKYSDQLNDVQAKLKAFDGVDVEDLKSKVTILTGEIDNMKQTHAKEIDDMRFNSSLESKINSMSPKNAKAVMALLNVDELKTSKNQDSDITAALEKVKKENDYLFGSSVPTKRIVTGTDTTQIDNSDKKAAANEAFRSLLQGE